MGVEDGIGKFGHKLGEELGSEACAFGEAAVDEGLGHAAPHTQVRFAFGQWTKELPP